MSTREGIFAGDDPVTIFRSWVSEAERHEINDPNAAAVSTVDSDGLPNVRILLLKEIEDDAFVFYTNYESAKGRELFGAGKAAFNLHWKSLRRQIRVRGLVAREDGAQADAYYASRPLGSRIGAWASDQSRPLKDRATLEARVQEMTTSLGDNPSRPPHWGGFRIRPLEIEFWADGEFRLHDRFQWRRATLDAPWTISRLNP